MYFRVWQHIVCMFGTRLTKKKIPKNYLCEICEPREVDVNRAKVFQNDFLMKNGSPQSQQSTVSMGGPKQPTDPSTAPPSPTTPPSPTAPPSPTPQPSPTIPTTLPSPALGQTSPCPEQGPDPIGPPLNGQLPPVLPQTSKPAKTHTGMKDTLPSGSATWSQQEIVRRLPGDHPLVVFGFLG